MRKILALAALTLMGGCYAEAYPYGYYPYRSAYYRPVPRYYAPPPRVYVRPPPPSYVVPPPPHHWR